MKSDRKILSVNEQMHFVLLHLLSEQEWNYDFAIDELIIDDEIIADKDFDYLGPFATIDEAVTAANV